MEVAAQVFLQLVKMYGLFYALLSVSFIICVIFGIVMIGKLGYQWVVKFFKKRKEAKLSLSNHQFFNDLQFLKDHKLKQVNTTCIIRKQLYIDIMRIRIECFYNSFMNFIKQDLNSFTNKQLFNRVQGIIDDANSMAISNALSAGIPTTILNSMNEKRKIVMQFNHNAIKGYCYNVYLYADNVERMSAILQFMLTSIECYMNILQENLASFNGDIKRMNYKGKSCTGCRICVHDKYLQELKSWLIEQDKKSQDK